VDGLVGQEPRGWRRLPRRDHEKQPSVAHAAIVIWTSNSVHSDWVRTQAGRANTAHGGDISFASLFWAGDWSDRDGRRHAVSAIK